MTHRTIRCLVSKPTNMVETWNVRETTTFIRDLAEYVTRGMLLFEAIASMPAGVRPCSHASKRVEKHCYEQAY